MAAQTGVIDPAVLDRLSGLALVARKVVEGYMAGHHTSPHRGSSIEFAQPQLPPATSCGGWTGRCTRAPNDWWSRSTSEETSLSLNLLVDASESMAYASGPRSKFDYARWCAAALAHLVIAQRDQAGLVIFDNDQRTRFRRRAARPGSSILQALSQAAPAAPPPSARCCSGSPRACVVAASPRSSPTSSRIRTRSRGHQTPGARRPRADPVPGARSNSSSPSTATAPRWAREQRRAQSRRARLRQAYLEEIEKHNQTLPAR
ncbi:MAG: hypothetical protein R3E96_12065 [Planctomycetota bacterium]